MDTCWLGEPGCDRLSLVGGKTAQLSRLAPHHLVPPGFCITTPAYERAVALAARSEAGAPPKFPSTLYDMLALAYRDLGRRTGVAAPAVAVRSSAVDEDGQSASFAGQHDTYLNISGVELLAEAVARCWESARSTRAVEYRRHEGLAGRSVQLAVLVQQLVVADTSAVVFSADPVSGHRDRVVINASWGLGESVVGGIVTPDTYVVDKATLTPVSRKIANKERMTVAVPGGSREVDVPKFMRLRPALAEAQIVEMARLAMALEERVGWPVDAECCYKGGRLYLLQCRPITRLGGAPPA